MQEQAVDVTGQVETYRQCRAEASPREESSASSNARLIRISHPVSHWGHSATLGGTMAGQSAVAMRTTATIVTKSDPASSNAVLIRTCHHDAR